MADKVYRQESKEFQMKIIWPVASDGAKLEPGKTDQAIFERVRATLVDVITQLAGRKTPHFEFDDQPWRREGIRYDTAPKGVPGILKQNNLTLAVEATDTMTKLKCKAHHFVPELLYDTPKTSASYPDIKAAARYKHHDAKFKLEEDLHFSNLKYCASGSVFVKGRQVEAERLAFFSQYFPALENLLPAETRLHPVSHWDEAVFDQFTTRWGKNSITSWMLVNRWQWDTNTLLESELSFKVDKEMGTPWDLDTLHVASTLYLALKKTGIFMAAPPIFFYDNPVSSVDIRIV
ncbi:hypothetical protein [Dechloromonas sp. ZS-1]|uniref:hypothetical protein n=1 Tax=Dechloromonas sp. ZS-1 TaxID=3138067 RepID=UPI0031FC093D